MRLAALELGPPPAAPPPATANNAVGGGVGGTFHGATLPQKVSRICTHFGAGRALLALCGGGGGEREHRGRR